MHRQKRKTANRLTIYPQLGFLEADIPGNTNPVLNLF